jgi:hypothetical protein
MPTIVTNPFGTTGTPGVGVVCEEDAASPKILEGKEPRWQAIYNIFFTDSESEARLALESSIPADREGLVAESYEIESKGGGLWRAEVLYSLLAVTAEEEFDTTGGSAVVKLSYGTRSYGPGAIPVFNGAINCNGGRVDGVSIPQPAYAFNYTRTVLEIDFAYKQLLYRNVGKTNNATWKGFAAGEVLFLGSRGRKSGRDKWKLQWFFAASPNLTGITLGPLVTVTRKDGWEYLWVLFDEAEDTTARQIVQRPRAAYVEQVHLSYDFSLLGLGV